MKLFNTLTKRKEEFKPISKESVKLFVCGPTVYDESHIGHAKTYIQMDILARTLKANGYNLDYLQNITDIDDKIITRATECNKSWDVVSKEFFDKYVSCMNSLNNNSVTKYIKATERIPEIISQVQRLTDLGFAYKISDGIYFEVAKSAGYGELSGRQNVTENDALSRIDNSDEKKAWKDFCLWKFSKPGEPVWPAPFGDGRPGWHIEDTAISESEFGPVYDIHGGAIDLIFPHHEAEIAQMKALSGKTDFVNYWVHTGFLNIDGKKMSKSLKNFVTVDDLLSKGYKPMSIRLLMMQSHYRSTLDFKEAKLVEAEKRLMSIRAMADLRWQPVNSSSRHDFEQVYTSILNAFSDDLATPLAFSLLSQLMSDLVDGVSAEQISEFIDFLNKLDELLGLGLMESNDLNKSQKSSIEQRGIARKNQDWEKSDELREKLADDGIIVRDSGNGQIWSRA